MKTAIISSTDISKYGRMGADFHILLAEHRPIAEELLEKYEPQELLSLAWALPYREEIAQAVSPTMYTLGQEKFLKKYEKVSRNTLALWRSLAAYCAAASDMASSIILEEVLELSKQKKAKLEKLKILLDSVKKKGAVKTAEAIKRGTK